MRITPSQALPNLPQQPVRLILPKAGAPVRPDHLGGQVFPGGTLQPVRTLLGTKGAPNALESLLHARPNSGRTTRGRQSCGVRVLRSP
jgi:hypothetical protein